LQRPFCWDYLILQVTATLTPQEVSELCELEDVIAQGFDSFLKTGLAFARIRFYKLYRATHDTFESYCKSKWGLSLSRTNQIINTVKVVENITDAFPEDAAVLAETTEHMLRALSRLEPELQTVTWELIRHIEERPSGTTIEQVVSTIRGAIQSGWEEREGRVASEPGSKAKEETAPSAGRNGTTQPSRTHRASDDLGNFCRWSHRVESGIRKPSCWVTMRYALNGACRRRWRSRHSVKHLSQPLKSGSLTRGSPRRVHGLSVLSW
jgi:hypothetical protein